MDENEDNNAFLALFNRYYETTRNELVVSDDLGYERNAFIFAFSLAVDMFVPGGVGGQQNVVTQRNMADELEEALIPRDSLN